MEPFVFVSRMFFLLLSFFCDMFLLFLSTFGSASSSCSISLFSFLSSFPLIMMMCMFVSQLDRFDCRVRYAFDFSFLLVSLVLPSSISSFPLSSFDTFFFCFFLLSSYSLFFSSESVRWFCLAGRLCHQFSFPCFHVPSFVFSFLPCCSFFCLLAFLCFLS